MMDQQSQIYISFEAIFGVLAVIGNSLVLVAIYKTPRLQTAHNCFIASLALADLLVGIVAAPLAALSYLGLPNNFYGCVFTNCIVIVFTRVSIFSLGAIACERFVAIKKPFLYREKLTMRRAKIINFLLWILGILVGFIPLFGWNLRSKMTDEWTCNFMTVIDMDFVVYFHFYGCIVLPLILITAIYSYIFYIVRKQLSQPSTLEINLNSTNNPIKSWTRFKKEVKVAKTLAIVIILFAFCWIPIEILNILHETCGSSCPYPLGLLLAAIVLSHANSSMNPAIYAYANSNFRDAFKKMLCMKSRDYHNQGTNNSREGHHNAAFESGESRSTPLSPAQSILTNKSSYCENRLQGFTISP